MHALHWHWDEAIELVGVLALTTAAVATAGAALAILRGEKFGSSEEKAFHGFHAALLLIFLTVLLFGVPRSTDRVDDEDQTMN
jgi:hypothetical protein